MHVAGMEEKKCIQIFGAGKKLKTKESLEDLGADGRNTVFCSWLGTLERALQSIATEQRCDPTRARMRTTINSLCSITNLTEMAEECEVDSTGSEKRRAVFCYDGNSKRKNARS